MTREEIQEFNNYRKSTGSNLKAALKHYGITYHNYYKSRRLLEEGSASTSAKEDLGTFIPVVFSKEATGIDKPKQNRSRNRRESELAKGNVLTIEMRTPTGTELRIQGQMNVSMLREILNSSSRRDTNV